MSLYTSNPILNKAEYMIPKTINKDLKLHLFLACSLVIIFGWSLIRCADLFTWCLEAFPVVIAAIAILFFYRIIRLTNICYILIWIHAIILLIGAHYTYAEVPLFNWLSDTFDLSRNHYDRLGHFFQGFAPAIVTREVLMLATPLKKGKWLSFIIVCICLAISAAYELLEWAVAEITATAADAFLGTQGDIWDTQKDMAFCLIGAIVSLILLSRLHDKQMKENFIYRLKKGFA